MEILQEKVDLTDPYAIAKFIKNAEKSTPVKAYIKGDLKDISTDSVKKFGHENFWILVGEYSNIETFLEEHKEKIQD
ncbi:2,3,4,5-tetrahydropyridine-2,6-dicarboxylate N-acetyltransferase, partial [Lutibacter sp. B2]|nr:2,3,4,5-tetrahydropyridine-2,6-dicarboxylate N-acetyltransferase [Lutibacter sp. B2]